MYFHWVHKSKYVYFDQLSIGSIIFCLVTFSMGRCFFYTKFSKKFQHYNLLYNIGCRGRNSNIYVTIKPPPSLQTSQTRVLVAYHVSTRCHIRLPRIMKMTWCSNPNQLEHVVSTVWCMPCILFINDNCGIKISKLFFIECCNIRAFRVPAVGFSIILTNVS